MSIENPDRDRIITIRRILDAPIELVWEAWTHPEHICQWWAPKKMNTEVLVHDFRIGGLWKYRMVTPDGKEFITAGVYLEIVKFEKIVSSADFKPLTENVEIRALFEQNGPTTNLIFQIVHPTEEYKIRQEKMGVQNGWGAIFDKLDQYLHRAKIE